jgi:hypothetical protein
MLHIWLSPLPSSSFNPILRCIGYHCSVSPLRSIFFSHFNNGDKISESFPFCCISFWHDNNLRKSHHCAKKQSHFFLKWLHTSFACFLIRASMLTSLIFLTNKWQPLVARQCSPFSVGHRFRDNTNTWVRNAGIGLTIKPVDESERL